MSYASTLRRHLHAYRKLDYVKAHAAAEEAGAAPLLDCSFGINPFGYSSRIDPGALLQGVDLSNYPPFPYNGLKDALIRHWSGQAALTREHIRVCAGSMMIVDAINSLFLDAGDAVLGYSPQFPQYVNSLRLRGGVYDACTLSPANGYRFEAGALLDKLEQGRHKLVYLDNPNNPTGQVLDLADVAAVVAAAHRRGTCVIVDEAYGDYMEPANSAINLLARWDNLFVVRSFSKGYALAALRVGYLASSPELAGYYGLIDDLLVNPVGLGAAKVSLSDAAYLPGVRARVAGVKGGIVGALGQLRVAATDPHVPIFVLEHPDPAVNLYDLLASRGVLTTSGFEGLGQNAVRVRIPASATGLLRILQQLEADLR